MSTGLAGVDAPSRIRGVSSGGEGPPLEPGLLGSRWFCLRKLKTVGFREPEETCLFNYCMQRGTVNASDDHKQYIPTWTVNTLSRRSVIP